MKILMKSLKMNMKSVCCVLLVLIVMVLIYYLRNKENYQNPDPSDMSDKKNQAMMNQMKQMVQEEEEQSQAMMKKMDQESKDWVKKNKKCIENKMIYDTEKKKCIKCSPGSHFDTDFCSWYGGYCNNGELIEEKKRTQEDHCGSCDPGYYKKNNKCIPHFVTIKNFKKLFALGFNEDDDNRHPGIDFGPQFGWDKDIQSEINKYLKTYGGEFIIPSKNDFKEILPRTLSMKEMSDTGVLRTLTKKCCGNQLEFRLSDYDSPTRIEKVEKKVYNLWEGEMSLRGFIFVGKIRAETFYENNFLTSITIPADVVCIGQRAFYKCEKLERVTFFDESDWEKKRLDRCGFGCFMGCSSLKNFIFPSNAIGRKIGDSIFEDCTSLESITLPEGMPFIPERFLANCSSLKSIIIPSSVEYIQNQAFVGCCYMTDITIPIGVIEAKAREREGKSQDGEDYPIPIHRTLRRIGEMYDFSDVFKNIPISSSDGGRTWTKHNAKRGLCNPPESLLITIDCQSTKPNLERKRKAETKFKKAINWMYKKDVENITFDYKE